MQVSPSSHGTTRSPGLSQHLAYIAIYIAVVDNAKPNIGEHSREDLLDASLFRRVVAANYREPHLLATDPPRAQEIPSNRFD